MSNKHHPKKMLDKEMADQADMKRLVGNIKFAEMSIDDLGLDIEIKQNARHSNGLIRKSLPNRPKSSSVA